VLDMFTRRDHEAVFQFYDSDIKWDASRTGGCNGVDTPKPRPWAIARTEWSARSCSAPAVYYTENGTSLIVWLPLFSFASTSTLVSGAPEVRASLGIFTLVTSAPRFRVTTSTGSWTTITW
jgi:hypothetical protein